MTAVLVRDLMRHPVLATEGMWFREMVRLVRDRNTECLVIVDAAGRLAGVVTEEDLLLKVMRGWLDSRPAERQSSTRRAERRKAAAITARELMSEPVHTIDAAQPASDAARIMREHGVRHLVMVDRVGVPAGIVDRSDLIAVLLRPDEEIRQDVEDLMDRQLRGCASTITAYVENGVVVLECRRKCDFALQELVSAVEAVDGVVAVHVVGEPANDRWRWPTLGQSVVR